MSNVAAMQAAMQGLWFKQVVDQAPWDNFRLAMDQETLSYSVFNPADAMRLLIWIDSDSGMEGNEAADVCKVPREVFQGNAVSPLPADEWERVLGRLALCLFASMRNEWRREHGRDAAEMEDVLKAPETFRALLESGARYQTEH